MTLVVKPRTLDHYAQVLRDHVYPTLGTTPLRSLTRPMLKAWLGTKTALSRETVKNLVIPLRAMLNDALDDGLTLANPAVRPLKRTRGLTEQDPRTVKAYTKDELGLILQTADARRPEWADFFKVLGWCGLRAPKSGKGRKVDVPQALVERLQERRSLVEAEQHAPVQNPHRGCSPRPPTRASP